MASIKDIAMFEVKRYSAESEGEWDRFVRESKNGTFLFERPYMDYHSDRFADFSLMVYRKGKLYAVLPANRSGEVLYTHQGLTYGGFVMSAQVTAADMLEVFGAVNSFLKENGFCSVVYKAVPYIYDTMPSQEDLYALFRIGAKIVAGNLSSAIFQENKVKFTESRKSGIRKAKSMGLVVAESEDFAAFWGILSANLQERYAVKPVHSLEEITLLKKRFPDRIRLYLCLHGETAVGGALIYETGRVVHTQYISGSREGKACGALDLLFDYLINERYAGVPVFDFGQSTENMGNILNENLIFQKEGFGGRGVMYYTYEYTI